MPDATAPEASVVDKGGDRALYGRLKPGPGHSRRQVQRHQQARLQGAMLEAVASHGFQAVTVRRLIALAGVSTATFYQHFANVEDCFASTHETLSSRLFNQAKASARIDEQTEGLAAVLTSLLVGFASNPEESKLILLEAYSAGPAVRSRISRTEDAVSELIAGHLPKRRAGAPVPWLATGLTAAVTRVARVSLEREGQIDLGRLGGLMANWASVDMEPCGKAGGRKSTARTVERRTHDRDGLLRKLESAPDDRSRIYAAVVRLSCSGGVDHLTTSQVCAQAGVPRRVFEQEFGDPLSCLLELTGRIMARTATHARRVAAHPMDPIAYLRSTGVALCEGVAHNPTIARLCWVQVPHQGGLNGLTATDRWISLAAADLADGLGGHPVDQVMTEAILAGVWALMQRLIEERRIGELIGVAPAFADLFEIEAREKTSPAFS